MHGAFDVLPRPGQDRLQGRVADDLTHRAFGHRLYRAFRLLNVEQILFNAFRIGLDLPQHRKVHVDNVFVAGEHQALFRHVAHRGAAAQVLHHPHADIDLVDAQGLRRQHRLDRIGQMIIEPGIHFAYGRTEAQHDAALVRLDAEEPELAMRYDRLYVPRNDPRYLRRNALVALGNTGRPEDAELAEPFRAGEDPLLREQAEWAVARIEERHGS